MDEDATTPGGTVSAREIGWERTASAERLNTFADAVVAIAMTLLVLPLAESVPELAQHQLSTSEWAVEHSQQIFSFLLSFILIASAWRDHHLLFDSVDRVTGLLVWVSVIWMLTIVWLPVPTAMLALVDADTLQKVFYIGTLLINRLAMLATRLVLLRRSDLHELPRERMLSGLLANAIYVGLLVVILIVAILIPGGQGYYALIGLALIGVIHRVIWSRIRPA